MPELAEVETVKRGIAPHITGIKIDKIIIRHQQLRWPIPKNLNKTVSQQVIRSITRRAKYLLFTFDTGTLIVHLGMSGRLYLCALNTPVKKHDHVDFILGNHLCLRFNDPRRFGSILWTTDPITEHSLLKHLGIEPLERSFTAKYLLERTRNKKVNIKTFIMDSKNVVGVGNIYAAESLFRAHIHPLRLTSSLTLAECKKLAQSIKDVLKQAIKAGGTTLKDFVNGEGKPGYFTQKLQVYQRAGQTCVKCATILKQIRIQQRSTVFCPKCQPL